MDIFEGTFYVSPNKGNSYFFPRQITDPAKIYDLFSENERNPHSGSIFLAQTPPEVVSIVQVQDCRSFLEDLLSNCPTFLQSAATHLAEKYDEEAKVASNFIEKEFGEFGDDNIQEILNYGGVDQIRDLILSVSTWKLADLFSRGRTDQAKLKTVTHYLSAILPEVPELQAVHQVLQFDEFSSKPVYYHQQRLAGCGQVISPEQAFEILGLPQDNTIRRHTLHQGRSGYPAPK